MNQETMKALVYHGPNKISLDNVPVPQIEAPGDVILRVTLTTPCTSDVHISKGHHSAAVVPPVILGHEFCGEIVAMGSAVEGFKLGDRVHCFPGVVCDQCPTCLAGLRNFCQNGGVYGTKGINGALAEYVKVPYGAASMVPIPDELADEDVIMLADMLATAWFGVTTAEVTKGSTVTVFGVGPVGMCACILAKNVLEAKTVIAVDLEQYRLDICVREGIADYAINPNNENVVEKIMQLTGGIGTDASVDTAGAPETISASLLSMHPYSTACTVAMIPTQLELPVNMMFYKNLTLKAGLHRCEGLDEMLDLIKAGKINTRFMQTHRGTLDDVVKAFDIFGNKKDGCVKYILKP